MTTDYLVKRYGLDRPKGERETLLYTMCRAFADGGQSQLASSCAQTIRQLQTIRGAENASTED